MDELQAAGIEVVSREPIIIKPQPENKDYLDTKREIMGHFL